jgi:3-oxoacyl-[acyl-carrier-protein] synthase-3
MVIAHQSNQRILESARDRLGLPESRFYINIDRYGNTSAASVGICLHELTESGRIGPGDLVLFVGIGGGLTWASSLWRL